MDGVVEVLIPVLIAGYSAVSGWYECTGAKDQRPLVENMCGDLREALNASCATVISLPIPQTAGHITLNRSLVLSQLSNEAKAAASDSYQACRRFWGEGNDFEKYKRDIARSASILNAALKRSPTDNTTRDSNMLSRALIQQGVSPQALREAVTASEKNFEKCGSATKCVEPPNIPNTSRADLLSVKIALESKIASVETVLENTTNVLSKDIGTLDAKVTKLIADLGPKPDSQKATALKFVTEVYFGNGRSDVSKSLCKSIAVLVTARMSSGTQPIAIYGYADVSGLISKNEALSKRRAGSVEACLKSNIASSTAAISVQGAGPITTLQYSPASMRRASIYLKE